MSTAAWEVVFMMFILKLPIVYLCWVVWWAVRAEPRPLEGAALPVPVDPEPQSGLLARFRRGRRRRPGPHGSPVRAPARRAGVATARASVRR
jgi:hypothetical protein